MSPTRLRTASLDELAAEHRWRPEDPRAGGAPVHVLGSWRRNRGRPLLARAAVHPRVQMRAFRVVAASPREG